MANGLSPLAAGRGSVTLRGMRTLIIGITLTVISLTFLLIPRGAETDEAVPRGPERTTKCMVWKAERGKATVWLCGSIHLLRESDYPLPAPYLKAFEEAATVVMELPPGAMEEPATRQAMVAAGRLPEGKTLQDTVGGKTWDALTAWSGRSGMSTAILQPMKPWMAGISISVLTYERLGFSTSRGMESWFTERLGKRQSLGLETPTGQLGLFDKIDAATQEEMILQAIDEEKNAGDRIKQLLAAWHEGDAPQLAALMDEGMAEFPGVKKLLLDDRNAAWIPEIEKHLDGTATVMVLVGSGHLAGKGGVVDLLEQKGVRLTQQEYRTTRLAPAAAGKKP